MGARAYVLIDNYRHEIRGSIVEIGGERGEGSTSFLQRVSSRLGVAFHTVDMVNTGMTGERWLREVFPALRQRIAFAYLDNFDWTYESVKGESWLRKQIEDYAKAGVVMNNDNSMAVHLEQTQLIEPFAAENCAVLFDDTWPLPGNRWTGKGGTAIPWLLARRWRVLETVRPCLETYEGFALLARGQWNRRVIIRKPERSWNLGDPQRDFAALALAAAYRLAAGQTLVLYGMGKNGQAMMRSLLAADIPVGYVDDNFDGEVDAPRLSLSDLGPSHAVLITPDAGDEMFARVRHLPVGQVWRQSDLMS